MARELGIEMPGWKRSLIAFVASLCAGYAVGWLGGTIISCLLVGAASLGTSMLLVYSLTVLIFLATIYAGLKVGQKVGMYIVTGNVDRDIKRLSGWVKAKFADAEQLQPA